MGKKKHLSLVVSGLELGDVGSDPCSGTDPLGGLGSKGKKERRNVLDKYGAKATVMSSSYYSNSSLY